MAGGPTDGPVADGTVLAKGLDAGAFLVRVASGWPAGVKVQLVEGAAVVDAPGAAHQAVAGNVFAKLVAFTGRRAGPGDDGPSGGGHRRRP